MKTTLSTVILGLVLLFTGAAQARLYDVYYYWDGAQYQQYWPQQYDLYPYGNTNQYPEQLYDPYYQLHVVHYQLYLPQYQPYFLSILLLCRRRCYSRTTNTRQTGETRWRRLVAIVTVATGSQPVCAK